MTFKPFHYVHAQKKVSRRRSRYLMALVLAAICLFFGLLFLWPRIQSLQPTSDEDSIPTLSLKNIRPHEVRNVTFVHGETNTSRSKVNAAQMVSQRPDLVHLKKIGAETRLQDGHTLNMTADQGQLNPQKTGGVQLDGHVTLTADNRHRITSDQIDVNFESRTADIKKPLEATSPFGTLVADKGHVDYDKKVLELKGKSHITINDDDG